MRTFNQHLSETTDPESHTVEIHLHEKKSPVVILTKNGNLMEKMYHKNEGDHIDGKLYKVLGKFKPTSLDHQTIMKEFHHHLYKHGYYAHSPTHPLVMSPKEQAFKSELKGLASKSGVGKHERPHRDGGSGSSRFTMSRHVALWSTKGSTHIFTDKNKRIPQASIDGRTTIVNDEKAKHAASGERDRWFLRQAEIRKLPPKGLHLPGKGGKVHHYGDDIDTYVLHKEAYKSKIRRDVLDFHKKTMVPGTMEHSKKKEFHSLLKKFPEFHPDELAKNTHGIVT